MCEANLAVREYSLGRLEGRVATEARQLAEQEGIPWDEYRKIRGAEVR